MTKNDIITAMATFNMEAAKNTMKADILKILTISDSEEKEEEIKKLFNELDDVYELLGIESGLIATSKKMKSMMIEILD